MMTIHEYQVQLQIGIDVNDHESFYKKKITMIIYINSNPHFLVEILQYDIQVLPPYRIYNNNDDNNL